MNTRVGTRHHHHHHYHQHQQDDNQHNDNNNKSNHRIDFLFPPLNRLISKLIFVCFIAQLSLRQCDGSHYVKYYMSDYCDGGGRVASPIMLLPIGRDGISVMMLKLKRETYRGNMSCTIRLSAPPNYGLMAFIVKLKMRRISPNRADRLEFIAQNHTLLRMYGINQETAPPKTILIAPQVHNQNRLDIHFHSENSPKTLAGKGFKIVINLYTNVLALNNECDTKLGLDFNCGNDICIDNILECDSVNNCRNDEDELQCDETSETKLSLYVFIATIVVMIGLIMMYLMKNKEKRKEIVRRMSRVYGNNPMMYVMNDNDNDDSDSQSSDKSSSIEQATPTIAAKSAEWHRTPQTMQSNVPIVAQTSLPQTGSPPQQPADDESSMVKAAAATAAVVRCKKLSLSLPHGIDQIGR